MKKILEALVSVVLVAAIPGSSTDRAELARKEARIVPVSKLSKARVAIPGGRISVTLM